MGKNDICFWESKREREDERYLGETCIGKKFIERGFGGSNGVSKTPMEGELGRDSGEETKDELSRKSVLGKQEIFTRKEREQKKDSWSTKHERE